MIKPPLLARAVLNARTLAFLLVGAGIFGIVASMVPTLFMASLAPATLYAAVLLSACLCWALILAVLSQHRALRLHLTLLGGAACIVAMFWLQPEQFGNVFIFFFMLGGVAAVLLPLPQALPWEVLFYLLTLLNAWLAFGLGGLSGWYGAVGAYIFFGIFGFILQQADSNFRRNLELYDELQGAHEQLRRYAQQEQQLAVAEERNRLAREMHDSLGHQLTVVMMQLEGAQRLAQSDPAHAAQLTTSVRRQLKEAMNELRNLLNTLRTSPEDDGSNTSLPKKDTAASLEHLIDTFALATGLNITLQAAALPTLPPAVAQAIYRTVQEGLTNVHRHASAERAWVTLEHSDDVLGVRVEDDGVGFGSSEKDGSFGLVGLQERAAVLGGTLTLAARAGGGTILRFDLKDVRGKRE